MSRARVPADPGRRYFLKVGMGASATLLLASSAISLSGCRPSKQQRSADIFTPGDRALIASLAPALLGVALTGADQDAFQARWEALVRTGHPALHRDLRQLFDLLHLRASRWPLTGLWQPIPEASAEQRAAFLTRWQHSRLRLLRFGHQGLTQLAQMAWYSLPRSWAATGYPGPPTPPKSTEPYHGS